MTFFFILSGIAITIVALLIMLTTTGSHTTRPTHNLDQWDEDDDRQLFDDPFEHRSKQEDNIFTDPNYYWLEGNIWHCDNSSTDISSDSSSFDND